MCVCVWKIKTGFDKPLHEMEQKIYGTVCKKLHSTENSDEIEIDDTVAVMMSHWNRWVRGQLKEVTSDGNFLVWAIDYGVPIISKSSHVIKLPPKYTTMNVRCPRIHIGGLMNCIPAEGTYDFQTDNMIAKETSAWSKKAIEIGQTAIGCAIQMKFECSKEFTLMNRVHRFGHLACQKPDGTWTDLTKCLSNAFVTKITTDDCFQTNVHQMESIRQAEWKTDDEIPIPLDIKIVVIKPMKPKKMANDIDEPKTPDQSIDSNPVTENKVNKKSGTSKSFGPFQAGPQTRPYMNQYPPGMKSNRGFDQMRRGGPRNRWSNSRDYSHNGGRSPAQWEQEYFESCFRKPTQKNEPSSGSSSAAEDSNDDNHDEQTTVNNENETKQEDPNKSNEIETNGHESTDEMKNDTAAAVTAIVTATAAVDIVDDNSTNGNDEKNTA